MRVIRIHGWGEGSFGGTDGRAVHQDRPHEHRTLYVIAEGEATVGEDRTPVGVGQAVEVDAGEALSLRSLSETLRVFHVVFAE
jgi:mannose-6-phosphate isomerase-like protein (cupin superfamily)